jgi:hypothetical protein
MSLERTSALAVTDNVVDSATASRRRTRYEASCGDMGIVGRTA